MGVALSVVIIALNDVCCRTVCTYLIMHLLSETEQHVRSTLRDAIVLLCQTGLKFNTELSVDGLLAVTLDKKHVFLLSIKETLQSAEPCVSNDDLACVGTDDNQVLNFSSVSPSAGCNNQIISNVSELECSNSVSGLRSLSEMPTQCAIDTVKQDIESLTKADQKCRRRQRKQQRTVRRYLDASCPTTSPCMVSVGLSDHHQVVGWTGNENSDMQVYSESDGEGKCCSGTSRTALQSDEPNQKLIDLAAATLAESSDQSFPTCGDQECDDAVISLRLAAEDQKVCDSETAIEATQPSEELAVDFGCMSQRSHCKQRLSGYADHRTCLINTPSTTSVESLSQSEHIPALPNNEIDAVPILNEVQNDRFKMESLDHLPNSIQSACQDTPANFHLSADVKSEIVDTASSGADIVSQLASLRQDIQPSSDAQQQIAMMSQFGLSAVVASMQSHFAMLPKPFPWSVRTFPSLSPPSLSPAQCGMVGIRTQLVTICN